MYPKNLNELSRSLIDLEVLEDHNPVSFCVLPGRQCLHLGHMFPGESSFLPGRTGNLTGPQSLRTGFGHPSRPGPPQEDVRRLFQDNVRSSRDSGLWLIGQASWLGRSLIFRDWLWETLWLWLCWRGGEASFRTCGKLPNYPAWWRADKAFWDFCLLLAGTSPGFPDCSDQSASCLFHYDF